MDKSKVNKGDGHRQRLRERFLAAGLAGFHDYEVIELLLTIATPRKDCKDAAKAALKRFRTIQGVLEASPRDRCEVKGIAPKNLFGIKQCLENENRITEPLSSIGQQVSNA